MYCRCIPTPPHASAKSRTSPLHTLRSNLTCCPSSAVRKSTQYCRPRRSLTQNSPTSQSPILTNSPRTRLSTHPQCRPSTMPLRLPSSGSTPPSIRRIGAASTTSALPSSATVSSPTHRHSSPRLSLSTPTRLLFTTTSVSSTSPTATLPRLRRISPRLATSAVMRLATTSA